MKTVVLTSSSPTKSSTTDSTASSSIMDEDRSENRDSCYFPGCRKDANCNCEMCLASINATLDLMPNSSLTKISANKPAPRTPISFNPSVLSTPKMKNLKNTLSPPLNSTARMSFHNKVRRKKRDLGTGFALLRLMLGLSLIFGAEMGFSWVISEFLKPKLSPEIVRDMNEKSWVLKDVNEKLDFLQKELQSLVNGDVSNCSTDGSLWKINQGDLLLNSQCMLYKSATEEVKIWGWPLQTAGLLTSDFSSRSLTILAGRVTEWSDGKISFSTMKANQSWVHNKWSASVLQFDLNTWILEYRQAGIVENSRLISAVLKYLHFRLSREVSRMKHEFWLLPDFRFQYNGNTGESFKIPT